MRSLASSLPLLAGLALATCGSAAPAVTKTTEVYGRGGDQDLQLDLYRPAAAAERPRPAVVFYHGGGWSSGERSSFARHCQRLAESGFVAATASYRLAPRAKFPAQIEDAKCAVRWLRANAAKLAIDPDRIGVGGGSAGGQMALLVAYAEGYEGEGGNPGVSSRVACAVTFNPVIDLAALGRAAPNNGMLVRYLGVPYPENPELYELASPRHWVRAGAPPTWESHGEKDTTVPYGQATDLMDRLEQAHVPHELFTAQGASHGFYHSAEWFAKTYPPMERWLQRWLQG